MCYSRSTSYKTFSNAILLFIFIIFFAALSGCERPSNALEEQERSAETMRESAVSAESIGYEVNVTDLGSFIPSDINNAGQIAGSKKIGDDLYRAVLWEDGKETILAPLRGNVSSFASSINNNGRIVGRSGARIPVSWKNGKLCRLCKLKPGYRLLDINDERQVLGAFRLSNYFVYQNGEFSYFNAVKAPLNRGDFAINNSGVVAGNREHGSYEDRGIGSRAFIWSDGEFTNIGDPDLFTYAFDINDKNQVVGSIYDAFLWDKERGIMDLGNLGSGRSIATGINNKSQVVGASRIASDPDEWHVFLWENGTMIDLGIKTFRNSPFARNTISPFKINNNGQIVGQIRTSKSGSFQNLLIEIEKN